MTARGLDPTGKRALFEAPVAVPSDHIKAGLRREGKTALFSTPPRSAGTVIVECSHCKARTRTSLVDLGVRLASGSAWVPLRRYSRWMRCPDCNTRQWCRVGWRE
jgi:hypothetical protein